MAAAGCRGWNTTATEQGIKDTLSQIIAENGVNIIFITIDWKASRHNKLRANMALLDKTIRSVVRNRKPTMICMCEVGMASENLTEQQMQEVSDQCMQSWIAAATEHCVL